MKEVLEWIDGRKTHIGVIATTILGILTTQQAKELGVIPESWQGWIMLLSMISAGLTVSAGRSAISQVQKDQVHLANIQLRELDEGQAAELLEVTKRRTKLAAAKKPKPKGKP